MHNKAFKEMLDDIIQANKTVFMLTIFCINIIQYVS